MACKACRTKKTKCDRVRPVCQNCRQRVSLCSYAGERRVRRWTEADAENRRRSISQNDQSPSVTDIDRHSVQRLPDADPAAHQNQPRPCPQPTAGSSHFMADGTMQNDVGLDRLGWNQDANIFAQMARDSEVALQTPAGSTSTKGESLLDKILDGDEDLDSLKDASPALWGRSNDGDEYTGPSSGISTVSDLGLSWIREKVPDSDLLCETIQDIRNGILSHICQPKCITQDLPLAPLTPHRILDLPQSQLLDYVDAYVTQIQVVFPILDRDTFHSRLAEMGDGPDAVQKPSWMASLNVVVASGLRDSLSDETSEAFQTSGSEAWGYFRSTLSYESQIVHDATDILAMLEYTLSSVASQLAQSIGLNCTPPPEWNLSEVEKKERNPSSALTTIFIHVVSNPHDSRNQSDIALMETVIGFFGRLEYVTSGEAAFTKTTEFVRQARRVIDSYKNKSDSRNLQSTTSYEDIITSMEMPLQDGASTQGRPAEVMEIYASNSNTTSHDVDASNIAGIALLPQAKSSRMETVGGEDHPVSGVPNDRIIGVPPNSHALYSGLTNFAVPNVGESIQVQW
ncbi:hypothetical protein CSAL01_06108 [Colletotrichum salicis]|uniref:Zn(2)-C6 fungal-type domain-containing protein n=1 Tax=Colletotrichum salicis TaxID=1209931 RepID=A0A135VA32_9PEZI|nr:hypothetical protein CSAL01_06108 [Colletotrichum salicis]